MKQKTRILIYILIAAAVVIIGAITILSGGKPGENAREHLDLGRKYLNELSYDEAETEFLDAIRIDPSDPAPYIELARLYTDTGRDEMATDILETGHTQTGDEGILKALEELNSVPGNGGENDTVISSVNSAEGTGGTVGSGGNNSGNGGVPNETEAQELAEIPDLAGLSEEEAVSLCEERGFMHSISRRNSDNVKKGFVMEQSIPAGTMAAKGIGIPFAVSEGRVMVEIPDLSGLSEEEAKKVCGEIGIAVVVSYESSNDVPEGAVISQNIPAGAMAAEGASVRVSVSDGSAVKVELLAQVEFDYLADFEESGWAFAVKGNKGGYVDLMGQFVEVYDDVHKLDEEGNYGGRCYEINGACLYLVNGLPMNEDDLKSGPDAEYYIDRFKVNNDGIYPYCQNGKWGYANINTGKIIIPCQYNDVTYFNCGRCFVRYDDPDYVKRESESGIVSDYIPQISKILDMNGNEILINNGNDIVFPYYNSCFLNNVAVVDITSEEGYYERYAVIDVNGKVIDEKILTCPYEIWNTQYSKESKILTYIRDGDSHTWNTIFIDENGKKLCSLRGQYYVNKIAGRYALCSHNMIDYNFTKYSIIDLKDGGKVVGQFDIGEYNYWNNNFGNNRIARGIDGEQYTLFDFNGNRLINSEYDFIGNPSFERIGVGKKGKWGFIDPDGNLKIDFIYDNVYWFFNYDDGNSLCMLCEDGTSSLLIDKDGNEMYRFRYSIKYVDSIDGNNYIVTKKGNNYAIYKISE